MLCGIAEPWLKTLKMLKAELGINPVYYISWKKDLSKETLHTKFPDCYYQTIEDAWKGKGFPTIERSPLDEELLRSVAHEELIFLKMLDRLDLDGHSFSLTYRSYFFQDLLSVWLSIIDHKNIKLIISPSVPHRGFDYALYVAAKIRGIEFLMFQMTPFGDSSFILDNINQTPNYLKRELAAYNSHTTLREDIERHIDKIKGSYDSAVPPYMVKQKLKSKIYKVHNEIAILPLKLILNHKNNFEEANSYHVQKGTMPLNSKTKAYQKSINVIRGRKYKLNLEKYYTTLCNTDICDKYILIALHYQPEETSCPTGGRYADQILIVKLLDAFLDKDIDIVIKEHKTQFYPFGKGECGRDKYFYLRLREISSRIKFVPIEEDPFNLIDGALATVTISGTIGWESVIRRTPAIIFGRAWYEDMPGVYKVKSYDDLVKVWPKVLRNKNHIEQNLIINYHKSLQKYLIEATHYKSYVGISKRTFDESSKNLYKGILNHLAQKGWKFDEVIPQL